MLGTLVDDAVISLYCSNKRRTTLLRGLLNFVRLPLPTTPYIYVVLARVQTKSVCFNDMSVLFLEHDINAI